MRMLASAGILVGFCGGGGSPMFTGSEIEGLTVTKAFQEARVIKLKSIWEKDRDLKAENFFIDDSSLSNALNGYT